MDAQRRCNVGQREYTTCATHILHLLRRNWNMVEPSRLVKSDIVWMTVASCRVVGLIVNGAVQGTIVAPTRMAHASLASYRIALSSLGELTLE